MIFQNKDLYVLAYVNGVTLWHYKTTDNMADLLNGYFNPVADLMSVGDIFLINAGDQTGVRVVTKIENKNVELGDLQ